MTRKPDELGEQIRTIREEVVMKTLSVTLIAGSVLLGAGLAIGATMSATAFLNLDTGKIMLLGLIAFVLDTVAGLLFGKLMCVASGYKINPLIGAAGISAFPMAGRLAAKTANDEDPNNFILMHAMGANTAGQLGSVIAGGILLAIVSKLI